MGIAETVDGESSGPHSTRCGSLLPLVTGAERLSAREMTTESLREEIEPEFAFETGVNPGRVGTTKVPEVIVEVMVTVGLTRGQRVAMGM